MNTGAPWPGPVEAGRRVRVMQTKLHRWATADPGRCFDDLYNLVYDPAFLVVAWRRVRENKGAQTSGVDGVTPRSVGSRAEKLLVGLRDDLKARRFVPQRVRQKTIPKGSGRHNGTVIISPSQHPQTHIDDPQTSIKEHRVALFHDVLEAR